MSEVDPKARRKQIIVGLVVGLVIGKPVGIVLFTGLGVGRDDQAADRIEPPESGLFGQLVRRDYRSQ